MRDVVAHLAHVDATVRVRERCFARGPVEGSVVPREGFDSSRPLILRGGPSRDVHNSHNDNNDDDNDNYTRDVHNSFCSKGGQHTPSPPIKSLYFRGFDSSRPLILRGGNSHVR